MKRIAIVTLALVIGAGSAVAGDDEPMMDASYARLVQRIAPRGEPAFVVWGQGGEGGNATLRDDIAGFGRAAVEVSRRRLSATQREVTRTRLLGLLERYRAYIAAHWPVTARTEAAFAEARATIERALPASRADNPYLDKVDQEIADPAWREAIRAVQPATVKLGGGSGVNLAAGGLVLTAAHVVDEVGRVVTVRFPDGRSFRGVCVRLDDRLDLALVELTGGRGLPVARLAREAPEAGDDVAIVGQPGKRTPDGEATGYLPWHVSTGEIRGFRRGDRTGEQHLGRAKHDAWTYWGHSGSPLFDRRGRIVALHNSWDSKTAMRHAVTWEAITAFLARPNLLR